MIPVILASATFANNNGLRHSNTLQYQFTESENVSIYLINIDFHAKTEVKFMDVIHVQTVMTVARVGPLLFPLPTSSGGSTCLVQ